MDTSTDHDLDPVLAELRAARPDVDPTHTDAASPAAAALRTRIVQSSDPEGDVLALPRRPHARRTRWLAAAAAAVVVALVAVGAGVVGIDGPQPASASIEDIAAATDQAARGSGKATITYEETWPDGRQVSTSGEATFFGDDLDLTFRDEETLDGVPFEYRQRVVDGEHYFSSVQLGEDPMWGVSNGSPTDQNWFDIDPRLLFQMLEDEAGFTVVGEEELDGRPVTHLRATNPDAVAGVNLGQASLGEAESLDALDLWVDDDVVYRLDVALTRDAAADKIVFAEEGGTCPAGSTPTDFPIIRGEEGSTPCLVDVDPVWVEGAYSVRFHDLGVPVTIEPPANVGPAFFPAPR